MRFVGIALVLMLSGALAGAAAGQPGSPVPNVAFADLVDTSGNPVGTASFFQIADIIARVDVRVEGLTPGFHGFHVHDVGACSPDFTAAAGHYNPGGDDHGDHAGDLPVLLANEDGAATASYLTDRFTVEQLVAGDVAVIVHANPDNYANIPATDVQNPDGTFSQRAYYHDANDAAPGLQLQPGPAADTTLRTGDAGGRVACGVVEGSDEGFPPGAIVPPSAFADLRNPAGESIGEIGFVPAGDGGVRATAFFDEGALSPGFHGFHVHDVGACSPDFTAAGGHYNPQGTDHRDHAGDMPLVLAAQDGSAFSEFETDRFGVRELADADVAVIVHANPDNYANIPATDVQNPDGTFSQRAYYHDGDDSTAGVQEVPGPAPDTTLRTGDAGGRVACGVVEKIVQRGPCVGFAEGARVDTDGDGDADVVVGTPGDDVLAGTDERDLICGLRGDDVIKGRGGNDRIHGGSGTDTLRGNAGADRIFGGRKSDTLFGGSGDDRLGGGRGPDTLWGRAGDDVLKGGRGGDTCIGGGGRDVLRKCELIRPVTAP
ncbi:MAG: superoxide dismutase family protein [Actinomycetota bacterium]